MIAAGVLGAVIGLAAGAPPALADPALAGQWRFDEGAGQRAFDDGPLGLHGTLGSAPDPDGEDPLRISGPLGGGALRFRGGSSVAINDHRRLDLDRLVVEAVARGDASPGPYRYLVSHGSVACFSASYGLYTARDGGLAFYVFDGERYFVSSSARQADVWDGEWHRLTGTFDGQRVRAFVDGREIGTPLATPPGTAIEYASMPEGTYVGTYVGSCRRPFVGDIDSVRIWSGASSPATVAEQAGMTVGPPLPAAVPPAIIPATRPDSSCSVRASRTHIRAQQRVAVTLRAAGSAGPLPRVRLSIRRANGRRVIAAPRTNAGGSARLVLKIPTSGRLRIGVIGRSACTPAFIRVSAGA